MRGLLHRLLVWLQTLLKPPASAGPLKATITFEQGGLQAMGEITVSDDSGPINATVAYEDAQGNPANPADTPTWASSDESVATVEAAGDGLSATVTVGSGTGSAGEGSAALGAAAVISVVAHDDDGEEVRSEGTITVQPSGDIVIGEIEFEVTEGGPGDGGLGEQLPGGEGEPPTEGEGPTQAPEGEEPQVNPLR